MKSIYDDLAQREAEAEKLRQTIRNTPTNDPAYVSTHKNLNNYSRLSGIWPLFLYLCLYLNKGPNNTRPSVIYPYICIYS